MLHKYLAFSKGQMTKFCFNLVGRYPERVCNDNEIRRFRTNFASVIASIQGRIADWILVQFICELR